VADTALLPFHILLHPPWLESAPGGVSHGQSMLADRLTVSGTYTAGALWEDALSYWQIVQEILFKVQTSAVTTPAEL